MPLTSRDIVIIGVGETAEMALDYFQHDSPCRVVAFSVDAPYITSPTFCGLPVVDLAELEQRYPPGAHGAFVAASFNRLNRVRARLYDRAKAKGYALVSYVSSRAFIGRNVRIGDNCFILENNVVQYGATIGNDVVMWCSNQIGHRVEVGDHCFITSGVVLAGFSQVGEFCFFGANSCVGNHLKVGRNCLIGMGAFINANTDEAQIFAGVRAQPSTVSSFTFFGVPDEER